MALQVPGTCTRPLQLLAPLQSLPMAPPPWLSPALRLMALAGPSLKLTPLPWPLAPAARPCLTVRQWLSMVAQQSPRTWLSLAPSPQHLHLLQPSPALHPWPPQHLLLRHRSSECHMRLAQSGTVSLPSHQEAGMQAQLVPVTSQGVMLSAARYLLPSPCLLQ